MSELAAPTTPDVATPALDLMDDGEVLTPRAPARCDPNAKRRARAAKAETRNIPNQQEKRDQLKATFSTGWMSPTVCAMVPCLRCDGKAERSF